MPIVTIDRKELKAILPTMKRHIPKGRESRQYPLLTRAVMEFIPGSASFSVTSAGMTVSLTVEVPASGPESFSALVPIAELDGFVRSSSSQWISLELEGASDRHAVTLGDGIASLRVPTEELDDYPRVPRAVGVSSDNGVALMADTVADSLAYVVLASSTDPTRYSINSVYFDWNGESAQFIATDGHRMHVDEAFFRSIGSGSVIESHIVPIEGVKALLSVMGKKKARGSLTWSKLDKIDSFAEYCFAWRNWTISYQRLDSMGEYPSWRQVVPSECVGRYCFEANEAIRALESQIRASKQAKAKKPFVALERGELEPDVLSIGRSGETWSRIGCQGPDTLKVGADASYLRDALKGFAGKRASLKMSDADGLRAMRVDVDDFGKRYAVVMPSRL